MKAINNYLVVENIKEGVKDVGGLLLTEDLDSDNRYLKAKIISILMMWAFGLLSIFLWIPSNLIIVKITVFVLLVIGTIFILRVKTSST